MSLLLPSGTGWAQTPAHDHHGCVDDRGVHLGASMLPFVWNIFKSYRYGEVVVVDDPWGYGNSLEWVTTCPPPRHNFTELPRIRSERPAFELHYPHMADRMRAESHVGRQGHPNLATESAQRAASENRPRGG